MPAGRDIPAAGAGGAGARPGGSIPRLPAAAARQAGHRWALTSHPIGERQRGDVPAAGPAPSCARSWSCTLKGRRGEGRGLPRPGAATPGAGPAGREGRQQPRARGWTRRAARRGAGRCLEAAGAAGTAALRFGTRGMFAAPGNRSGSPSTNPVPVEAYQGCKHCKRNLKSSVHTPSTSTKERKKNTSRGFFPQKGQTRYCIQLCPKKPFIVCGYSLLLLILTGLSRFLSTGFPPRALQAISVNCAGCAVHRSGQHKCF